MELARQTDVTDRMCVVTREVRDEDGLIRFVRGPDGGAVPDLQRRLPGRGVWVSLSREMVLEAVRRNLFSRGFGEETKALPELAGRLGELLRKQALSYISLAKKAGEAVAGNGKVEDMLGKKLAQVVLHAAEAASDGKRKIDGVAGSSVTTINIFSVDELDLAFGRSNVIHAAISRGKLAEKLIGAVRRIENYDAPMGS